MSEEAPNLAWLRRVHTRLGQHSRDTNNEQTVPLLAAGVFEGAYTKISEIAHFEILYLADTPFTAAKVWSNDGVNPVGGLFGTSAIVQTVLSGFNVCYDLNEGRNLAPYYKLRITNGATPQTAFNGLSGFINITWLMNQPYTGSFGPLESQLNNLSRALLVRAVGAGTQPDGDIVNARADGEVFISTTNLSAGGVLNIVSTGLGTPREKASGGFDSDGYNTIEVGVFSDVAGSAVVEYCDDVDSVTPTFYGAHTLEYGPDVVGRLQNFPIAVGLDGFRITYTNNLTTGQSDFLFAVQLRTTAAGPPKLTLDSVVDNDEEALMTRAALVAPDAAGDNHEAIGRDGLGSALNSHVKQVDGDVLQRALTAGQTRGVVVGIGSPVGTPTRLDTGPLSTRRCWAVSNDEVTNKAYVGFSSGSPVGQMFPLPAGRVVYADLAPGVALYGIAKNTGSGTQNDNICTGTTSAGSATNLANAKVSDNAYANITATGQTVDIGGFTITPTGGASIQNVLLRAEFKKQSAQFQTVAHVETRSGSTAGSGTVATASMLGGSSQVRLAEVTRNDISGTVTGVTCGGITFTAVPNCQNISSGNRRVDLWVGKGIFTSGVCTATLSNSTNAHITCSSHSGADQTSPVQASNNTTGTGTAVTGPVLAGTNKGFAYLGVSHVAASAAPGAGYTERVDLTNGTGSNIDSIYSGTKPLVSTGNETGTATLATSVAWAAVGVTLLPAVAADPTVTISYQLSAVTGATTQTYTLSSTADTTVELDVTNDRTWAYADIPNVHVFATGSTIGDASADVDKLDIRVVETTAPSCDLRLMEVGAPT